MDTGVIGYESSNALFNGIFLKLQVIWDARSLALYVK